MHNIDYPNFLVDIHNHILWGLDDGSQSRNQTLEMLRIAADEGITHMIATPHFKMGHSNATPGEIERMVFRTQALADLEGIPIKFFAGNEVLYFTDIERTLAENRIHPMANSEKIMVEFMPQEEYDYIRRACEIVMGEGFDVIVAHAERYAALRKDINRVFELKRLGAEIQVNAGNVIGLFSGEEKRAVKEFLDEQLVDYIGTDAHSTGTRSPRMREACALLYSKYDSDYVDSILYKNALDFLINNNKR